MDEQINPYDQAEIDAAKAKKNKKLLIILAFPVAALGLYSIWTNFIDFGSVKVYGETPFDIVIPDQQSVQCKTSPCEFKLKSGSYSASFYRFGYTAPTTQLNVPLWSTLETSINFTRDAFLEETKETPDAFTFKNTEAYSLKLDSKFRNYKLTLQGDDKPLTYFQNRTVDSQIIGTDTSVLIVGRDTTLQKNPIYFVDVKSGIQKLLGEIDYEIIGVKPSPNGRTFLVKTRSKAKDSFGKTSIKLIDKASIRDSNIGEFEMAVWNISNEVIHFEPIQSESTPSSWNIMLGDKKLYEAVNITVKPSEITPDMSGTKIYFKSGEKSYRLNF